MNRATRRSKKAVNVVQHDLVIAGLKVTINSKLPDGVMVVSEKEGERLAQMVAEATAKKVAETAETENEIETQKEG